MANPVLINDLRKSLWRRKPVLAVALMAVAILVLTFAVVDGFGFASVLNWRDAPLWRFPDIILPMIAPAFAAGAFAKEYEQRTWQDVMLTRLSVGEMLGGKLFACLIPTLVTATVLFPPFALMLMMQNVNWAVNSNVWIVPYLVKFVVSATFYVIIGLVCSFHSKSARTALVVGYVALFAYGIFNYLLWTFVLTPIFTPEPVTVMGQWSAYRTVQPHSIFDAETGFLHLSLVEWLHTAQSVVLSAGLLGYLALQLRGGRARARIRPLPIRPVSGDGAEKAPMTA